MADRNLINEVLPVTATGVDAIGEVQETPTAYTLLRRLKDLLTGIILAAGTAVIGKVRLVTATGDEITDDTADAIKTKGVANSGVDIGDVDVLSIAAGANIIGKVGIDQTTPGTTNAVVEASAAAIKTAVELIDNAIAGTEMQVDVVAALPTGTNTIGGTNPPAVDKVHKPFGKGSLTTDGVQYSTEVSGIGDTYTAIETATITQPTGYTLEEIELALTVAIKSSAAAEGVLWKMQASDNGTDWEDLIAEQTRAASAAAYADVSALGRFAPTGNFLGTGATFQVRAVVKSAVAEGETASGKMKNSSYVILKYRRA